MQEKCIQNLVKIWKKADDHSETEHEEDLIFGITP